MVGLHLKDGATRATRIVVCQGNRPVRYKPRTIIRAFPIPVFALTMLQCYAHAAQVFLV